jgi:hypothetical protein
LCALIVREDALPKPPTQFHRNLWNSYKEGFTGECTLKVSGEELKVILNVLNLFKLFQVSKMVLAANSEIFKKMLMSDTNQETINEITIYDFDVKTINGLIEYLHTESVENLSEVAFDLFKAADKYSIKRLKAS